MKKLTMFALSALFAITVHAEQATTGLGAPAASAEQTPRASQTPSVAASDCEAKAISKTGKPLAGAAKNAFVKKCEKDSPNGAEAACEAKAISKTGKPLSGAAKNAFVKKCKSEITT